MEPMSHVSKRALEYPFDIADRSFAQVGERTLPADRVEVDLAGRTAVVAYGSNAAPEVLGRKLAGDPDPALLLRAALRGFDVVYSAHVSAYGAVPATLHRSPGTEIPVFVAYLTAAQLELIALTEPNYDLAGLGAVECRLEEAESPAQLDAFLSRHGCLQDEAGAPLALSAIEARGRRFPACAQAEAIAHLAAAERFYG